MPSSKQHAVMVVNQKVDQPHENVKIQEVDIPTPTDGEVLIRILCRPIHPAGKGLTGHTTDAQTAAHANQHQSIVADVFSLQGLYPAFKPALPATPGLEGVAKVEKNGPGCSKYKEGQRVCPATFNSKAGCGSWQQYACIKEAALVCPAWASSMCVRC